jgi:hypothetical protein
MADAYAPTPAAMRRLSQPPWLFFRAVSEQNRYRQVP